MKKILAICLVSLFAILTAVSFAQDVQPDGGAIQMPPLPMLTGEHEWLNQFVGEWAIDGQANPPSQDPMTWTGAETVRPLGGYWIVAENTATLAGMPFTGIMTVGFDPDLNKYIGTWIDSMSTHLWKYEGTVDETRKILTLESQGPSPWLDNKITKFRDVVEFKTLDHRVLTSSFQLDDGTWQVISTANYHRKP